ncbi:unnamed protein product [Meganyctiphanes norvegica]|uniref:C-type lectin n=1 Tax=Meganyctiphanes norvegica TaxID=48144 RepID=A0AAV2RGV0_MEGNR
MIRCFSVIFLLLLQYSHQQDTVGGREILQHLSVIMNARFAVLDRRLNHMASMMTDLKPQHDQAHLEENISNIENKLIKLEESMIHLKSNQEKMLQNAVCCDGCGNGSFTCSPGYKGAYCRTPVCSDDCGNGECTSPGICTCSPGYTGASCRTPVCSNGCSHGECTSPGICTCSPGYTGASCRTSISIESDCSGSEGFFVAPGTRQCMKVIWDPPVTWEGAESLCRSQGLRFAKPQDAAALNKYLYETHGGKDYWVSGRGTGSGGWQWADGEALPLSDPLWGVGEPDGTSRDDCLCLRSWSSDIEAGTPYYDRGCKYYEYPICEVISN